MKYGKRIKKTSGTALPFLSGVLVPLSLCDYFGRTGWVFASILGSHKGGVLALVIFAIGTMIAAQAGKSSRFPTILAALALYIFLPDEFPAACACLRAAADGALFFLGIKLFDPRRPVVFFSGVFLAVALCAV